MWKHAAGWRGAAFVAALGLPLVLVPATGAVGEVGAAGAQDDELVPGATLRLYQLPIPVSELPELVPGQTPNVDRLVALVDFDEADDFAAGGPSDDFYVEVSGLLLVERAGSYGMRLVSDDGSLLTIDGREVVRNDGLHAPRAEDGTIDLAAGAHPFEIRFFENGGGEELEWSWRPPGADAFELVPTSALRTPKNVVRVTSPGPKRLMGPGGPMRPGAGMPLDAVHPSFDLVDLRPAGFEPQVGGLALLPGGTLAVANFRPNQAGWADGVDREAHGVVYLVENALTARGPDDVRVRKLADGFHEPAGLLYLDDEGPGGTLFVSHRYGIDAIDDPLTFAERLDTRRTVTSGWTTDNYHHFTFGLARQGDDLLATLSTSIYLDPGEYEYAGLNGPNPPNRGTLVRAPIDGGPPTYEAGGFRTPNGIGVGVDGRIYVSDNQGAWNPSNSIYAVEPGRFYGHYNSTQKGDAYPDGGFAGPFDDQPVSPPAVHLPQNECSNSPTQILPIDRGPLVREFPGQLLVGDLKAGGIRRVQMEDVDGERQGAVFRFSQGFECGVHRLAWGPNGELFVGGTGASDTWSWRNTRFGLQRLDPTDRTAFEMRTVRATPDGFEIEYTRAVDPRQLADPSRYALSQWRYEPTPEYGGEKLDLEELAVARAIPGADGRSVRLVVPGLRADRIVHLFAEQTSADGESIWSPECWYTLNRRPLDERRAQAGSGTDERRVLVFSRTTGFRHGSIPDGWRCFDGLASERGFDVRITEDPNYFTDRALAAFDAVVFLNTTGDVLDDEQQAAFERYVAAGGGFMGVHSASDTEYEWPWYGELVAAYFKSHPRIQNATVRVEDGAHASTTMLPAAWAREDEWYNFRAAPRASVHVLLELDQDSYEGSEMPRDSGHPVAWCHTEAGGRAIYTAGGHTNASYTEPLFREHLFGALSWAAGWVD
ncbi:Trehalose utilization [Planctomycetes bacterium Pla163]|uniref:Trehalose utilization n=1 Tax=Rohdeia mirabilis TaxID=2528008 RepID=A0A518D3T2_9BACT|nr:Trehalose utilization [Planctomycetes bacterium Pla163]